jgi:AraC family transcriptional activator of pobA
MIPIHDFVSADSIGIKVNKLGALNHYDASEHHRHNYFELFIFEKGAGSHEIDFTDFNIASNSVQIVAPGQVHKMKRDLDTNGFVILFEASVFESNTLVTDFLFDHICYSIEEMKPTYSFSNEVGKQIVEMAETIWKDYSSDNAMKHDFVLANLNLICIQCMRSIEKGKSEPTKNQALYQRFRRLLRSNFKTIKKVKEYAAELAVSDKQLNEIVSAKTGESASIIIYNQIILESKRLLNMGMSAKEVGYELNFDDPAHFSKFFKKQTGTSPSEFQKIHA